MIERIIEVCARHRWVVFGVTALLIAWSIVCMRRMPLDAIPDLSDPQVIVYTEWMGRSPDLVEDQITYPLVRTLQSTPGARDRAWLLDVRHELHLRRCSTTGTDIYWARTRVLEQLGRVQQLLPPDVDPHTGSGRERAWAGSISTCPRRTTSGRMDLARAPRAFQDFTVRPALQAVAGVAEVASLGGFQRQYQILLDPDRLVGFGLVARGCHQRPCSDANCRSRRSRARTGRP